ncbi:MAG: hypothetical protein ACXVDA_16740 [Ktedonobacterales bacterium]
MNPSTRANPVPINADVLSTQGVAIHNLSNPKLLETAHQVGFTWVRTDLLWSTVERKEHVYDFSRYLDFLGNCHQYHLKVLFILDYSNQLYDYGDPPTSAGGIAAFAQFAGRAAVAFRGQGVAFEIWNEPQATYAWPTGPNPAQYAALETAASKRIHQVDPAVQVTDAGFANHLPYLRAFLAAKGGRYVNAIAIHPYRQLPPETLASDLEEIRTLVRKAIPTHTPAVWDTEWGYDAAWYGPPTNPVALDMQATYVARQLLVGWYLGVPLSFLYQLNDPSGSLSTHPYGLLDAKFAAKPALTAVRVLNAEVKSRAFAGIVPTSLAGLHILKFRGKTDTLFVAWSEHPNSSITIGIPGSSRCPRVTNYLGVSEATQQFLLRCYVAVSDSPTYIVM